MQFHYAVNVKGVKNIIPVVLEPACRKPQQWRGIVALHLGSILHVDLARVDLKERIVMNVPVEAVGTAKGQGAGGTLDFNLNDVHVEGPAASIPEKIEVQIKELDLGQDIRIKDLELPADCVFQHEDDEIVLAVHAPRGEEEPAEAEEGAESEMPEVISKKKEDDEES